MLDQILLHALKKGEQLSFLLGCGMADAVTDIDEEVGNPGKQVPSPNLFVLAFGFVAAGVGIGCVETSQHTAEASLAPTDLRGSAFGLLAAVQSFGNIVASTIAGLLRSAWSPGAAFVYLSAWSLVALLILLRLALRSPSQSARL